jgi:hypothetical protein
MHDMKVSPKLQLHCLKTLILHINPPPSAVAGTLISFPQLISHLSSCNLISLICERSLFTKPHGARLFRYSSDWFLSIAKTMAPKLKGDSDGGMDHDPLENDDSKIAFIP